MTETTPMSPDTMAFFTAECHQVHALCDRAQVPRTAEDGSVFSMSQRVCVMENVLQGMVARAGCPPMNTFQ